VRKCSKKWNAIAAVLDVPKKSSYSSTTSDDIDSSRKNYDDVTTSDVTSDATTDDDYDGVD